MPAGLGKMGYPPTKSVVICTSPLTLLRFSAMVQGPLLGLSIAQNANWPLPLS
jgi:hypothetical protein